jgi:hypothetical protein
MEKSIRMVYIYQPADYFLLRPESRSQPVNRASEEFVNRCGMSARCPPCALNKRAVFLVNFSQLNPFTYTLTAVDSEICLPVGRIYAKSELLNRLSPVCNKQASSVLHRECAR